MASFRISRRAISEKSHAAIAITPRGSAQKNFIPMARKDPTTKKKMQNIETRIAFIGKIY